MKNLKILGIVVMVFAGAFLIIGFVLGKILVGDPNYIMSATGAFMSAFATSCLGIIAWTTNKIITRLNIGYSALIRAQYRLNEARLIISDNALIINDAIKFFKQGHLYTLNFKNIEIDREICLDFTYTELANRYFGLNSDFYRFNESTKTLGMAYEEIKSQFINNQIPTEAYKANIDKLTASFESFRKYCDLVESEILDVYSEVRVLAQRDKPIHLFGVAKQYPKDRSLFAAEKKILQDELSRSLAANSENLKKFKVSENR